MWGNFLGTLAALVLCVVLLGVGFIAGVIVGSETNKPEEY